LNKKIQDTQLESVLESFDGSVEAAAAAMRDWQKRQRQTVSRAEEPVLVKLEGVSRKYKTGGGQVEALKNVSLEVRQKEIIAVTGPSGSGKSTVLHLVGGLDRPDGGTVVVDGHNLSKLSDRGLSRFRNQTVGFVFQFFYLQPFLNLQTNLEVPGMFARLPREERHLRSLELSQAVGLSDRLRHLPRELSGGQMQRAAIARALLNRPKLILADEPTGNLDRSNAHAILDLFSQVRDLYGTTIIIVTHDQEMAARADREIALRDGEII
jgi:ABC-type lipoprotein export system ATPase subunit